ncbi:MAG TPA: hypothetical protein VET85_12365, partial [Stellaceae bacterium]|nr:hypothetical protein [Stellaceae bacterium]
RGISLNGGTIRDGAGNNAVLSGAATSLPGRIEIDTRSPTISSVTTSGAGISNGNGDLDAGKTVTLTVTFSEAVAVDTANGVPALRLNDGGIATYAGGSGTNALTFTYTVAAGQNTPDLAVRSLALNGGTIEDLAGNNAVLAGAARNPPGILRIDTTAPTVTHVAALPGRGIVTTGHIVTIALDMSEPVTLNGTPVLLLNDGGTARYDAARSTSQTMVFDYTARAGQVTTDLAIAGIRLPSVSSITDLAGNDAVLAGAGADLGLRVNTAVRGPAGPSGGTFAISGSREIELFGASTASVSFAPGDTGTLKLDASTQFGGTVAGLALGNHLDLADIAFGAGTTLGYAPNGADTGGTLTVSDGAHTASLALLGQYMAASFVMSGDGHGGTSIVDPPLVSSLTPVVGQAHHA